jgi:hypothetical protein
VFLDWLMGGDWNAGGNYFRLISVVVKAANQVAKEKEDHQRIDVGWWEQQQS